MNDYLVAIISLCGTCLGSMFGVIASARLTNYRLEALEKKVDKHNNFAERIPLCEQNIKVINHRLADIEREVENK